jgi:hypothetical protein
VIGCWLTVFRCIRPPATCLSLKLNPALSLYCPLRP